MGLPWDVFATPIAARKLARLGVEHDRVVLRPAFYRQLGESYGVVAQATCPLDDHDAPAADCSCGFYAVADDTQLWRLGADEPELAVLDVELAGRVIEHDHGYRASDQRVTSRALPRRVRALRPAGRGVRAAPLRRPRARVPPLRAARGRARRGLRRRSGCRSPSPPTTPRRRRSPPVCEFVLAQLDRARADPARHRRASRSPPGRASRSRAASSRSSCGW